MRKMTRMRRCLPVLMVFSVILFAACGDEDGPTEPQVTTYLSEGWDKFAEESYTEALGKFQAAVNEDGGLGDGWNGIGWTCLRLDSLDAAMEAFDRAVAKGYIGAGAHAGRCLIFNLRDEFRQSVFAGMRAIEIDPAFELEGDRTIDIRDVRLAMAQSYFALSEYEEARSQMVIIDPKYEALNPNSATFLQDLIGSLEELTETLSLF